MIIDDQKKKEALYEHLNIAYNQYIKGSSQQINTIIEQMARPSKQPQQITMWVDQFNRLILQLCKQKLDSKVLIDAILYQIPWFSSENHLKALQSFKKCVATILCAYPYMIDSVYQLLVARLNMQFSQSQQKQLYLFSDSSVTSDQVHKNDLTIDLLGQKFNGRNALIDEVQRILHTVEVFGEEKVHQIEQKDQSLILQLFKSHPNAVAKLNNLKGVGVGYFPSKNPTKCFYLLKQDGSVEDISFIKSIDNLIENLFNEKFMRSYSSHLDNFKNLIQMISELDRLYRLHQSRLLELLSNLFPHKSKHEFILKAYITNLLKLSDAIPNLRPKIIKLIVVRLISIDSEIKQENRLSPIIKSQSRQQPDEMQRKLDHLMSVLLEYFDDKFYVSLIYINNFLKHSTPQLDAQQILDIFIELQKLFQENILKNQQSRLVHFIFLVLCGQEQYLKVQQLFVTRLILNIRDESISRRQRINSVFYLSSLLIHCRGLRQTLVQRTFDILIGIGNEWLEKYIHTIKIIEDQCSGSNNNGQLTRAQTLHECELLLHIVQMFVELAGYGLVSQKVLQFLVASDTALGALGYVNIELLIKLNARLLKESSVNIHATQLTEITAKLLSRQYNKSSGSQSPSGHMNDFNSTPMINNLYQDYESYQSKHSTWTLSKQNRNQNKLDLIEYMQPFQQIPLVVSDKFVRKYFIIENEIAHVIKQWIVDDNMKVMKKENNKRKIRDINSEGFEQIKKKVK